MTQSDSKIQNDIPQNTDEADDDSFQLYDLRVDIICPPNTRILCGAKPGDHFTLQGEMMYLPPNQGISIYSLASVLPLLAAKQRPHTHPNDWMTTDAEVACPDPHCPSRLRIVRTGVRTFRRGEVTVVPLPAPITVEDGDGDGGLKERVE